MKVSEAAVFRWVVIVGIAGAAVVAAALLTRPLVGAVLGLVLVIWACIHSYRWMSQQRH